MAFEFRVEVKPDLTRMVGDANHGMVADAFV